MGNIKVADYLVNLTKYDDIDTDRDNRIILDKYIDRVHADKLSCHRPYFPGTKEPKRPYSIYRIKSPFATYIAKERRNSPSIELRDNVEKTIKVHNDAIWGKIYNDCGVNAVEGSVAYRNTPLGKLYYSITQHLKTLTNCNKEKLAYESPDFFLHLTDMLEKKDEYLQFMSDEAFDDLVNAMLISIISGETDMHAGSTYLIKPIFENKYTDICRIGLEEHTYDEVVDQNGSLKDIKDHFHKKQIYSSSLMSANGRIVLSPNDQIESIARFNREGLLSESNIDLLESIANYNVDKCLLDREDKSGAHLSPSHIDAIKFYLSQAEKTL